MSVRCSFKKAGTPQCTNEPQDARLILLPNGADEVVCLFCNPHALAHDAILWGARERARLAALEPPEVGAVFADDEH